MSYSPSSKNTGWQKTKKFLRKAFFRVAVLGAVAGTGYVYYGTKEDITAKIISVDTVTSSDKTPEIFIRTDKGTFVNKTTWMYWKNESHVKELATMLKPGATVNLSAYGLTKIRNINNVFPVINSAPANK
jgi:hypothetical protein